MEVNETMQTAEIPSAGSGKDAAYQVYQNLALILSGASLWLSSVMYLMNAVFNGTVNPLAIGALVLNCLSWLMNGFADDRSDRLDWTTFFGYFGVFAVLGVWWLAALTEPSYIPMPPVRILAVPLGILSFLNGIRQFVKVDKPLRRLAPLSGIESVGQTCEKI
jgi:hypothetical protein